MHERKIHDVNLRPSFTGFEKFFRSKHVDLIELFSTFERLIQVFNTLPATSEGTEIKQRIRTLRIQNFYGCTRYATSINSSYGMDAKFNLKPSGKSYKGGHRRETGKWRGYRDGKHQPRPLAVRNAEYVARVNLQAEMDHILWKAIDTQLEIQKNAHLIVRELPRTLSTLTWKALSTLKSQFVPESDRPTKLITSTWRLVEECSLSSLAALTVLYRFSVAKTITSCTGQLRELIVQLLMMLTPELVARWIAPGLFHYYLNVLFRSAVDELMMQPVDLAKSAAFLNLVAFTDPDLNGASILSHEQLLRAIIFLSFEPDKCASKALLLLSRKQDGSRTHEESSRNQLRLDVIKSNWDAVVTAMQTCQAPTGPLDYGYRDSKSLNYQAFSPLCEWLKLKHSRCGQSSLPLTVLWPVPLLSEEKWSLPLQNLMKRDWPCV